MKLAEIHFHDSRIFRVIEDSEVGDLIFEVNYPVDWDNNIFEKRYIVFGDVLEYRIDEGAFLGAPTLLNYSDDTEVGDRRAVTLHTNAGTRRLLFRTVDLLINHIKA